jgi:sulfite exporter TauE/SafE
MMLAALSGLVAGVFHVLSGPDHLAAVAPLAASRDGRGWRSGWSWGIGHAAGVVVVAAIAVLLRDAVPPLADISSWGERVVGGALIALGLWSLSHAARVRRAPHAHGDARHEHVHVQRGPAWVRRLGHGHAAFAVGVLHGVAGSSHVFGVLPALALPTAAASFSYILAFGLGTVVAMTAFAGVVGRMGSRRFAASHHRLMTGTGVAAIVVGCVWIAGA